MPEPGRSPADLVVKVGGSAALDPAPTCADIGQLVREGVRVVVVRDNRGGRLHRVDPGPLAALLGGGVCAGPVPTGAG